METIYLVLVIVLFLLAISDLVVGVSNDAVNFLNSAIGSKVAPLRVIMFIAALGYPCRGYLFKRYDGSGPKRHFQPPAFLFFGDHDHFPCGDDHRCDPAGCV